jgi:hypothetical protein
MQNSKPKTITTIVILLAILAVCSVISPFMNTTRILPGGDPQGNSKFGNNAGSFRPGNDPQTGNGLMPGQDQTLRQPPSASGFSPFMLMRFLGGQGILVVNIGVAILSAVLCALAAAWVWKQKRRGLNLALVLAILFLLGTLPGLFMGMRLPGFAGGFRYVITLLEAGSALAVLILSILPSVRDFIG